MPDPLFSNSPLSQHLERVLRDLHDEAKGLEAEELADREAALTKIWKPLAPNVPQLQRDEATFEVQDLGDRGTVTITIPFEGYGFVFRLEPARRPDERAPRGHSEDRWGKAALKLENTFNSGTTKDDVRAWAKVEVDLIEAYLDALRTEAAAADDELRAEAQSAIEERAEALSSFRTLEAELGKGI